MRDTWCGGRWGWEADQRQHRAGSGVLDGSRWAGVLPQRPELRVAAIRCLQRFRPTGKASQFRLGRIKAVSGLEIGDLFGIAQLFVGLSCGLPMRAVPDSSVCA